MSVPKDRKYTKDHEWVKVEGDTAVVGITEFAQSELGELVFAELPELGKVAKKGEPLCVVESTKAASDVYAPVSGTVREANGALSSSPDAINKDPYGAGWMVKLSGISDQAGLLSAEEYDALLAGKH